MTHRDFTGEFDRWAEDPARPPRTPRACCGLLTTPSFGATSVGPFYGIRAPRILFVGKDHGDADSSAPTPRDRREGILRYYRPGGSIGTRPWNPHYRGTVALAARVLNLTCATSCLRRCANADPETCTLYQFAQANAVKCVEASKTSRRFQGHHVIARCLPLLFDEIHMLEPHVLVLQSSEKGFVWHFRNEVEKCGRLSPVERSEAVVKCDWNRGGASLIWFNRHPAYLPIERYLEQWVDPHVDLVRRTISTMTA